MRKSNSDFKTAFVSESGAQISNNDYFAYVEHDDFACYVLASGITDFGSSPAAKEVVENLILTFEENPSMSHGTLMRYMKETNDRLLNSINSRRLEASVIMLVTDYEKFRYAAAGNVRLRMYRKGRFFLASKDMSLASDLIEEGKSDDPLDKHEERHNLYAYLGKKDNFRPYVSKSQKLSDSDIISLYTQGLWEHVDAQEIDEVFAGASDNPQESVDFLEEVLLSRQPPDLQSYTVVAIFVNKVYTDPESERKRKRYIKIAIIVLIILLIIGIIVYIIHRIWQGKVEDLQKSIAQTNEYIAAENFKRAQESANEALSMAKSLRCKEDEEILKNDIIMLDGLVEGDNFYTNANYDSAYDDYLKVLRYTSASDKVIRNYIQRRLNDIESHMDINQFMELGDHLFENGDYDNAESMYRKALERATTIHDKDAREKAVAAMEKVYDKRAEILKDNEKKTDAKKQVAISDAMKKGDDLLAAGDLDGAQKAYLEARNLSDNPADRAQISQALGKVSEEREKKAVEERTSAEELQKQFEEATKIEVQGDTSYNAGDYLAAQMYYMTAIEKFSELAEAPKVKSIQAKYDLARAQVSETQGSKIQAEDTEQQARNYYAEKNYEQAKAAATKAKELYTALGMKSKCDEMDILLTQIATDEQIADALK